MLLVGGTLAASTVDDMENHRRTCPRRSFTCRTEPYSPLQVDLVPVLRVIHSEDKVEHRQLFWP